MTRYCRKCRLYRLYDTVTWPDGTGYNVVCKNCRLVIESITTDGKSSKRHAGQFVPAKPKESGK